MSPSPQPSIRPVEHLFASWRRSGDSTVLAEVYDRMAPKLLAIALHTTGSIERAEDAVQSTFLAAIEWAERGGWERPLEPWLVGILTNTVCAGRRSATRSRTERLQDPPDRDSVDPEEIAASTEFRRAIEAALEQLPETYRTPLVLRLEHGLKPSEIAHALGRAPGTVRSQIHRGLETLRSTLPRGIAGGLAVWATPTRGLTAIRGEVLAAGERLFATTTAASAVGVLPWASLLIMAKPLFVLGAAAALAAIAISVTFEPDDGPIGPAGEGPDRPSTHQAPVTSTPTDEPPEATRKTAPARDEIADSQRSSRVALTVLDDDDRPVPNYVLVYGTHDSGRPQIAPLGPTDADGSTMTPYLSDGGYRVWAGSGMPLEIVVEDGRAAPRHAEIRLENHVRTELRVVDAAGRPLPGARVFREPLRPGPAVTLGTTDARGFFQTAMPRYDSIGAAAEGLAACSTQIGRDAESPFEVELALTIPGGTLSGRVVEAETAEPIEGAWIQLGHPQADTLARWDDPKYPSMPIRRARSAADGRFTFDGVAPGELVLLTEHPHHATSRIVTRIAAGTTNRVEVLLDAGADVFGRVVDAEGEGLVGATVALVDDERPESPPVETRSGARGEYRLHHVPTGRPLRLKAHLQRGARTLRAWQGIEIPKDAREARWDPKLDAAGIHGHVVDASGQPIVGARVAFRLGEAQRDARGDLWSTQGTNSTGVDGSFRLDVDDRIAGTWRRFALLVYAPQDAGFEDPRWPDSIPVAVRRGVAPGEAVRIAIADHELPSSWLHVHVRGGVSWITVRDDSFGRVVVHGNPAGDGGKRFEIGPLPPGEYGIWSHDRALLGRVTLSPRQLLEAEFDAGDAEPLERTHSPYLVPGRGIPHTFRFRFGSCPRDVVEVDIVDESSADRTETHVVSSVHGSCRLGASLLPGHTYLVRARTPSGALGSRRVEVPADASELGPFHALEIEMRPPG